MFLIELSGKNITLSVVFSAIVILTVFHPVYRPRGEIPVDADYFVSSFKSLVRIIAVDKTNPRAFVGNQNVG